MRTNCVVKSYLTNFCQFRSRGALSSKTSVGTYFPKRMGLRNSVPKLLRLSTIMIIHVGICQPRKKRPIHFLWTGFCWLRCPQLYSQCSSIHLFSKVMLWHGNQTTPCFKTCWFFEWKFALPLNVFTDTWFVEQPRCRETYSNNCKGWGKTMRLLHSDKNSMNWLEK